MFRLSYCKKFGRINFAKKNCLFVPNLLG